MGSTTGPGHIVLRDREAFVDVEREHGSDARMLVSAGPDDVRVAACARLVERALEEARAWRVSRIDTAFDVAAPKTAVVLEALRGHVGREVMSVTIRRAGASAMVTIVLSRPPGPDDLPPSRRPQALLGSEPTPARPEHLSDR